MSSPDKYEQVMDEVLDAVYRSARSGEGDKAHQMALAYEALGRVKHWTSAPPFGSSAVGVSSGVAIQETETAKLAPEAEAMKREPW